MNIILRRLKLGRTSCTEIAKFAQEPITVVRTDRQIPNNLDWVIRWGTTTTLPTGIKILNETRAIQWVNNKVTSRMAFQEQGIEVPKSYSFTAQDCGAYGIDNRYVKQVEERGTFVARPPVHAQGKYLFTGNFNDCVAALHRWGSGGYISKFIDKVSEYRVFVCQGRAVWVARKTPGNPKDVAWNVARGGRFDNVGWGSWPPAVIDVAIRAMAVSGLDFGGVDVMVDGRDQVYVLEINSAPSQTSPYRQQSVAKAFDWILRENNKEVIPVLNKKKGYLRFLHPALHAAQ